MHARNSTLLGRDPQLEVSPGRILEARRGRGRTIRPGGGEGKDNGPGRQLFSQQLCQGIPQRSVARANDPAVPVGFRGDVAVCASPRNQRSRAEAARPRPHVPREILQWLLPKVRGGQEARRDAEGT